MREVKILLKCAFGQEEVVQLGEVSRGFGRHADGQKVIAVNRGYFIPQNQVFYHKRQISGFPCVTLYINAKTVVMIGHYVIYFENILVFIFLLFWLIYFVIFERLILSTSKSVLLMSLCENNTAAVQKCYMIIAVIKILDIFWKNIRGEIS